MSEPLAERMRPRTLADYVGQKHLVGEGAVLRKMIDAGRISSFILWGPPGVGKTTLAQIVAQTLQVPFYTLSAVTSGVKDVREVIERAKSGRFFNSASPILLLMRFIVSPKSAGLSVRCGGEGSCDADWGHHGESFLRSDTPIVVSLPALRAQVVGQGRLGGALASGFD